MNQLIKINQAMLAGSEAQTVNARDLHAFLEVGKAFGAWIQERITQYGFVEHHDFEVFSDSGKNPLGGRPIKEYAISLDMAKELAMVERNEKGREARRYFIECERIAKQSRTSSHRRSAAQLRHVASEFRGGLTIAKLVGLKGNQAIFGAAKATERMTGVDPLKVIDITHLVAKEQARYYTPTELGERFDELGRAFNKRLEKAGLQVKNINGQWQPTNKGEPFAVLMDTAKRHSSGTPVQQLKWLETVIELLKENAA